MHEASGRSRASASSKNWPRETSISNLTSRETKSLSEEVPEVKTSLVKLSCVMLWYAMVC